MTSKSTISKGPFIYYGAVALFIFYEPPPPYISIFLIPEISKNGHFLSKLLLLKYFESATK